MKETFYVTKHALTKGILKKTGELKGRYFIYKDPGVYFIKFCNRRQFHKTFTESELAAKEMVSRKIASLRKQISKLEGISFKEPNHDQSPRHLRALESQPDVLP